MLRLLADTSLNHHLLTACRRRSKTIDFLSATKARIEGLSHNELLHYAADEDRILVTHDIHMLPGHFKTYLESGAFSPGVFLIHPQTPIADATAWLELASLASDHTDWQDQILEIPFLRLISLPAQPPLPRPLLQESPTPHDDSPHGEPQTPLVISPR
jgi:hypothetical protein